jgi:hypothetical protein
LTVDDLSIPIAADIVVVKRAAKRLLGRHVRATTGIEE